MAKQPGCRERIESPRRAEEAEPEPLHEAAERGDIKELARLLELRADATRGRGPGLLAPVFLAAQNGHAEAVRLLCAAGVDVNQPMVDGATPLYVAAQEAHVEVVRSLCAARADLERTTEFGATALYEAAWQGHAEVVGLLCEAGAAVDTPSKVGVAPAAITRAQGFEELACFLEAEALRRERVPRRVSL